MVTENAPHEQISAVNAELQEAGRLGRSVVAFVERDSLVHNVPPNMTVYFDRSGFGNHESQLFTVLQAIERQEKNAELVRVVGALGLIALGLYAFGELTKDS